jgi:hypothetical protein
MSDSLTAVASAGVGATAGLITAWVKGYLDYLQGATRELRVGALGCLDRLEKIQQAVDTLPPDVDDFERLPEDDRRRKTISSELFSLGASLDRYLNAIGAARRRDRERHFRVYGILRRILILHDFEPLPGAIADLRRLTSAEGLTDDRQYGSLQRR